MRPLRREHGALRRSTESNPGQLNGPDCREVFVLIIRRPRSPDVSEYSNQTEFGPASSRFLKYETPFAPELFRDE